MLKVPPGVFTRETAGLSVQSVRSLLRRGDARRLGWGVYAPIGAAETIELRAEALQLVVPRHTVACRTTASWLFGVDVRAHAEDMKLDLAVTKGSAAIRRPGVRGFVEQFEEFDIQVVHDLRTTSPLSRQARVGAGGANRATPARARRCTRNTGRPSVARRTPST
jgi:hypothetical protein